MNKLRFVAKIKKTAAVLLAMAVFFSGLALKPQCVSAAYGIADVTINTRYGQTEARKMLELLNAFRSGNETWYWDEIDSEKIECGSLMSLEYDYTLEKIAMFRALEVAICFAYDRPNGDSLTKVYEEFGYPHSTYGECICVGQSSVRSAFTTLVEQKEYYSGQAERRVMLYDDFTTVGIAHIFYDGTHYWVLEFGDPVNPDRERTAADDTAADRTVEVAESNISSLWVSADSITMESGTKKDMSGLALYLKISDHVNMKNNALCPIIEDYDLESSDDDILAVDDKKIKGVAEGEATLIVNSMGLSYEIPVTVCKGLEYIVTLDANGGSCNTGSLRTRDKMLAALPTPTREGYSFEGWFSGKAETASRVTNSKVYVADTTIYAHWRSGSESSTDTGTDTNDIKDPAEKSYALDMTAPSLSSGKKGKLKVSWKKTEDADGFQICYGTTQKIKKSKIKNIKNGSKLSVTIKKLKSGKKYFVRIRACKNTSDGTAYGDWSTVSSQKVK